MSSTPKSLPYSLGSKKEVGEVAAGDGKANSKSAPRITPAHSDDSGSPDDASSLRNYQIIIIVLGIVLFGIVAYFAARFFVRSPSYSVTVLDAGVQLGPITLDPQEPSPVPSAVADFALTLISVGIVGIVFELINRRAAERVTESIVMRSAANLGNTVANQATRAILGEPSFVSQVLTDSRRRDLLRTFILANIGQSDKSATYLAERAAEQFSGADIITDFDVLYSIAEPAPPTPPHAILRQSLTSSARPNSVFKFRFQVFSHAHVANSAAEEEDVFVWRYWLSPDEDPDQAIDQLAVVGVLVNGLALQPCPAENSGRNANPAEEVALRERWFHYNFDGIEADSYKFETTLKLPMPRVGTYIYIEPKKLTHGMHVACNYGGSNLTVTAIETLQSQDVRRDVDPGRQVVVRTGGWVPPTGSVSFIFVQETRA